MTAPLVNPSEPPSSIADPLMSIWNNIIGSVLGPAVWLFTICFVVLVVSFAITAGVTAGKKVANKGQPKKMSYGEHVKHREARTKDVQRITIAALSEADAFEYRRLVPQEKEGIIEATERLDQLEINAHTKISLRGIE